MKKNYFYLFIFFLFISCNLDNKIEKIIEISDPEVEEDGLLIEEKSFIVAIQNTLNGKILSSNVKAEYKLNDFILFTAVPEDGYCFDSWGGSISGKINPCGIEITQNINVYANFVKEKTYKLSILHNEGGEVEITTEKKNDFKENEKCILTAKAAQGYVFDCWYGDIASSDNTIMISFNSDKQVYAKFSKIFVEPTYSIKINSINGNGEVKIYPEKKSYSNGEEIKIKAIPNDGWIFSGWKGMDCEKEECSIIISSDLCIEASFLQRECTYMIYMCADNNLESAAIADFNELEGIELNGTKTSIVVLIDRCGGFDSTNDDWSGTRMYEIVTDKNGVDGRIVSKRLECSALDLSTNYETELSMSDSDVLKGFIGFCKNEFRANKYGLIIWGHGTGWKNLDSNDANSRAVAIDDTSGKYMSITELHEAIKIFELGVIGFDTCFGSLIEVAYELRDCAEYLIASAGIMPINGWNYKELFTRFLKDDYQTARAFAENAVNHFKVQYVNEVSAGITVIELSQIENVVTKLNELSGEVAQYIDCNENRKIVFDVINSQVKKYRNVSSPTDVYLDVYDFAFMCNEMISSFNNKTTELMEAVKKACKYGWSYSGDNYQLGVYFLSISSTNIPNTVYPQAYVNGSGDSLSNDFVQTCINYVPHKNPSISLLDKLFNIQFYK